MAFIRSLLRTTPMARAPCQVAICTAACPTLPLTPMTSTRLAGLRHAGAAQTFHRGDEGNADAGRLLPRNRLRFFDHGLALDHQMRGVGAVASDAEIAGGAEHLAPIQSAGPSTTTPA